MVNLIKKYLKNNGYNFIMKDIENKNISLYQKRMFDFSTINLFINKLNKTVSYFVRLDDNLSLKDVDSIKKDMLFLEADNFIKEICLKYDLEANVSEIIFY